MKQEEERNFEFPRWPFEIPSTQCRKNEQVGWKMTKVFLIELTHLLATPE